MSQRSFIEVQFPVSKVSKESYKERMANYSQTLTGLGKWWGRKPLVLVRATILGLLLPATDDPEKDRAVFLSLMTMDDEGLWRRKEASGKKITAKEIQRILLDERHEERIRRRLAKFNAILPGIDRTTHDSRKAFLALYLVETAGGAIKWATKVKEEKEAIERLAFEALYYDEKLAYCVRPEHLDGPSKDAWKMINAHLGTKAGSLDGLVEELGIRIFGHRPRVGDAFCGGGSIPFEAARIGCDVYASDLNPVAALLTWAALHIVGGGSDVAEQVRKVQEEIYADVDRQVTEWGIEHNEKGERADAYLYCVEVEDPETGWKVPLAPSWIIGEKTRTVAILEPMEKEKRYRIRIKMGATEKEMKAAKRGTVKDGYVVHPKNPNPIPMSLIRRENKGGLRLWENDDVVPRPEDVFQERLYCIRWTVPARASAALSSRNQVELFESDQPELTTPAQGGERYYAEPDNHDLEREAKAIDLISGFRQAWQAAGFIPSRAITEGAKTSEPIRTRGWTHWHHLFNHRQLLLNGIISKCASAHKERPESLVVVGRVADWNSKLARWSSHGANERVVQTYANQALNTLNNHGARTLVSLSETILPQPSHSRIKAKLRIEALDVRSCSVVSDFWVTDPPYADAVSYHELSEFFLAWYDGALGRLFPKFPQDSRRALAIRGETAEFRNAMVEGYHNLVQHMPENGLQIVMFTHQDAGVWADLALILWASGLRVSAAWTIATETSSALREGNYVQGTVLLVLGKNTSTDVAFLDELVPRIEEEVRSQVDTMEAVDDKEEPNFADTDYQLAAYAAALRVLTAYGRIQDVDVGKELNRERGKDSKSKLEEIIEEARYVAASVRIPDGISKQTWNNLEPSARFFLRGLEFESRGEHRLGAFQELARSYGIREYDDLLGNVKANEARVKTAKEFGDRQFEGDFGATLLRHVLYAIHAAMESESAEDGKSYLRSERRDYWQKRQTIVSILRFIAKYQHSIPARKDECRMAEILAGLLDNDTA